MINGVQKPCRCFITDIADLDVIGIEWFEIFGLSDVPINSLCAQVHDVTHQQSTRSRLQQQPGVDFSSGTNDVLSSLSIRLLRRTRHMSGTEAKLYLKPGARPVYRMKRPFPYAALEAVEAELNRLEYSGVLTKVEFSDWAAPIVAVKKANGSIRICADFLSWLNDASDAAPRRHLRHSRGRHCVLQSGSVGRIPADCSPRRFAAPTHRQHSSWIIPL